MKVHYYYPYKSDKAEKKYYILLNQKRKYILDRLTPRILQNRKILKENKDILNAMKKLRIGPNPVLILLDFGVIGYYGIKQALKKVMKILKNDFCKNKT